MKFGLKDTSFMLVAFVGMLILFYSYLIQSLALSNKKKVTDYPLGGIIQGSNFIITALAGVGILVLGVALSDDIFGKGNFKNKLYPTNTSFDAVPM